jgi:hypothetical protein
MSLEYRTMAKQANGSVKVVSVFLDIEGKPTKNDAHIIQSYREEADGLDMLQDDEVLETVKAIPGDEGKDSAIRDDRIAALKALQSEREDTEVTPSAMSDHMQEAATVGATIADVADTWMELGADSNETRIGAPLHLALKLMQQNADGWGSEFADNGFPIRCSYVLELPVPGSSSEDKEGTWGGENFNNFDIVKGKDGTERYYRTMSDTIGAGVQLLNDINDLKLMATPGYIPGSCRNEALGKRYENDKEGRKSKLGQLNTRRNQRGTVLSRAIAFLQTITRLNDEFDGEYIDWKFVETFDQFDEIAKRGKPLQLVSIGNKKKGIQGGDTDPFGLSQFIGLQHPSPINGQIRFERAKQLMGGKAELAASKLRQVMKERQEAEEGADQGGGKDALGKDVPVAPKPEFLEAVWNQTINGYDIAQVGKAGADLYRNKFVSFYNETGPEADKRLEAFRDALGFFNDILAQYVPRLNRIADEQTKRSNAA